jgi:MOSC domain-containing protein YiiM
VASGDPVLGRLAIVDVRVGRPSVIARLRGEDVTSAIVKTSIDPVTAPHVRLDGVNLAGDDQADRTVHGGPDKAVYCVPAGRTEAWAADGLTVGPGGLGENLAVEGVDERTVRIGDVWRWGDAIVQVSQPRSPCYKLAIHTGHRHIAAVMIASGRSGWYLRTVQDGLVPVRGVIEVVASEPRCPTVAEAFAAVFPGQRAEAREPDLVRRVLSCAALAADWRHFLLARNPLAAELLAG